MADLAQQFEQTDNLGSTDTYTGTVTTSPVTIPAVAGQRIDEIGIRCTIDQPEASRLEISYDGGTNWIRIGVGESREDIFRGNIYQIKLRAAGNPATCKYEVIMNRGPA